MKWLPFGDSKIPEPFVFLLKGLGKCLAISLICGSISYALKLFKPATLSWSINVAIFFAIAVFFLMNDMLRRREHGDPTNAIVPMVCCSIALGAAGYLYALLLSAVELRPFSIQYLLPLSSGALGAVFGFCFSVTISRNLFQR